MIVKRSLFNEVLRVLELARELSVDTETTGLRAYKGDRLFSLIIGIEQDAYYFNFQTYEGLHEDWILPREWLAQLKPIFENPENYWYAHNAKFDLHMLGQEGIEIYGKVHCTQAQARVVHNDHLQYSLEACAHRIGEKKDDAVDRYIDNFKLFVKEKVPGKKVTTKRPFYDRVPFDIIAPYGIRDAAITFKLGRHQKETIETISAGAPKGRPPVRNIYTNELRLTGALYRMEKTGIRIDRGYTKHALKFENDRLARLEVEYQKLTGIKYADSPTQLAKILKAAGFKLPLTAKGSPSTKSEVLQGIDSPIAKLVLEHRDAKSKADFYNSFLYHADDSGVVHPNLNPAGTNTGRLSSADPNFQNITNEEDADANEKFLVRRAIIPRQGFFFFCPDYDQMEYRLMLDYAGELPVINKILHENLDVHEATAQMMGVTRTQAKTINFMLLYGGGAAKLAAALKLSLTEAHQMKAKYFSKLPEIGRFIQTVISTARQRKSLFNWAGRVCQFPDTEFAYAAPNYLIQGGCADVMKIAINRVDDLLARKKSRMLLTVHDELLIEMHESEEKLIPEIREIMQTVYRPKMLPLTCGSEVAYKSWADKEKWVGPKGRDEIQGTSTARPEHAQVDMAL